MDSIGKLAAIAYPPGECTGSPEARKTYESFFQHPRMVLLLFTHLEKLTLTHFLISFKKEALCTCSRLLAKRSFAEQKNMFSKEGHALILQMDQDRCLEWLEELL